MPASTLATPERVIDIRNIEARHRDVVVCRLFAFLDPHGSLQLIADHDPAPLRLELEAQHGQGCRWTYLAQGPDLWRVRLQRVPG